MMTSIVIIQMAVHVIQTVLVMIVMYLVFDNPLEGSLLTLSALMFITGVSGMFFGTQDVFISLLQHKPYILLTNDNKI